MTESSGSLKSALQDQSLENQCSEVLKRIRGYLKFCYEQVITTEMAEWCVGEEILVFKEKLLNSERVLADLTLALVGKKASVYRVFFPLCRKVWKMTFWKVPSACMGSR